MTKPTVYIETSIVSYLTARPSRDLITAARQQTTRDWWDTQRDRFALVLSDAVYEEITSGDAAAALRREQAIVGIPVLAVDSRAAQLARRLLIEVPLPGQAAVDAIHVAVSAIHQINYLLTWNCTHLANAELRPKIEQVCREAGFHPPVICTPDELMELRNESSAT